MTQLDAAVQEYRRLVGELAQATQAAEDAWERCASYYLEKVKSPFTAPGKRITQYVEHITLLGERMGNPRASHEYCYNLEEIL